MLAVVGRVAELLRQRQPVLEIDVSGVAAADAAAGRSSRTATMRTATRRTRDVEVMDGPLGIDPELASVYHPAAAADPQAAGAGAPEVRAPVRLRRLRAALREPAAREGDDDADDEAGEGADGDVERHGRAARRVGDGGLVQDPRLLVLLCREQQELRLLDALR